LWSQVGSHKSSDVSLVPSLQLHPKVTYDQVADTILLYPLANTVMNTLIITQMILGDYKGGQKMSLTPKLQTVFRDNMPIY